MTALLQLNGVSRPHGLGPRAVHALRGVDLTVGQASSSRRGADWD